MPKSGYNQRRGHTRERAFWVGIARAFAGAVIFSLPMLMTMEMWYLGFYISPLRLAVLTAINALLLVGLARYWGFKRSIGWFDTIIDAFVGYAIGFVAGAFFLPLFGVVEIGMSMDEIIGKISLQAVPASIGALLARSQLGKGEVWEDNIPPTLHYLRELFIMLVGAIFLSFNLAPTEEIVLISYKITPPIALLLVVVSIITMHAFVYGVGFRGQEEILEEAGFFRAFLYFSVAGYALVLLGSLYTLWTFGRLDGGSLYNMVLSMTVLGLPGAIGAAAARLIL
ncbi:TIGR02587 family membrane protein [Nitrosococcus wardiae]|uniref:TIGR02587 family membrane protein n=1 Tax=Nitrosococcus wardiae TaxID=1814290 RepID=A0A4P7BVY7_9GAMM|nr:TIGR02587 family membrane protein [Nitrosococcus wardiae]QBQ53447.1 TIGR02587 family membrane protein [Nitrosococcus wardiae]